MMNELCWSPIDGYKVTEVICYYDFPRIFICHKEGAEERLLLGLWEDRLETENDDLIGDMFFLIPIESPEEITKSILAAGELDYEDYLKFSKDGTMDWVEARYGMAGDGSTVVTTKTVADALAEIQQLIHEGDENHV